MSDNSWRDAVRDCMRQMNLEDHKHFAEDADPREAIGALMRAVAQQAVNEAPEWMGSPIVKALEQLKKKMGVDGEFGPGAHGYNGPPAGVYIFGPSAKFKFTGVLIQPPGAELEQRLPAVQVSWAPHTAESRFTLAFSDDLSWLRFANALNAAIATKAYPDGAMQST